jgi:hypothetical protein
LRLPIKPPETLLFLVVSERLLEARSVSQS